MRRIFLLLRPIFYLLYHQFAWTYNFVAAVVSLGRWRYWVKTALPYLNGRVLELGFGPGYLQQFLSEKRLPSFGLDESRQMARQARRHLRQQGVIPCISCGYAQSMPFADCIFDSVVATFPAEYIFDPQTLTEIRRVLVPSGNLVILPMAWISGMHPLERLTAWLFRVSGEAPGKPGPVSAVIINRFTQTGFEARSEIVELQGSKVLVIIAKNRYDAEIASLRLQ